MSPEAQRITIAESCGWERKTRGGVTAVYPPGSKTGKGYYGVDVDDPQVISLLPKYPTDRNAIHAALLHHGIQSHDNPSIRVKFIGHLREIAGRRLPRNKSGASLMCDVDLVTCEAWELCESLLKTLRLWKS